MISNLSIRLPVDSGADQISRILPSHPATELPAPNKFCGRKDETKEEITAVIHSHFNLENISKKIRHRMTKNRL